MKAEYIIKSNAIFDPLRKEVFRGALAVNHGKIIKVLKEGASEEPFIGPETKVLSYPNSLVLPGFIDSHTHMFYGALSMISVDLSSEISEKASVEKLLRESKESSETWIFGFGWNHYYWDDPKLPSRLSLDRYFPDRPVLVINEELHAIWVNTKALELSGFFSGGIPAHIMERAHRDSQGRLTGYLLEREQMTPVFEAAFPESSNFQTKIMKKYMKEVSRNGIVSLNNIQCHGILNAEICKTFDEQHLLTARVNLVPSVEESLEELETLKMKCCSDYLKVSGVKGFVDGTPMGYTGCLVDDYSDKPGCRGELYLSKENFGKKAAELDKAGYQIRLHACGDGAVREALDIYEYALRANGRRDSRHTIEHVEVIHPVDLPRFRQLGVIPSVQPEHMSCRIFADHPFHRLLGDIRNQHTYPIKSFLKDDVEVAFGSDNPIVGLNPMRGIYRAVTRRARDGMPVEGWNPSEKISMAEALRAYTYGSAYQNREEGERGYLGEGSAADLAVIDRNLFKIAPEEILKGTVVMTMVNGEIVFEQ